MCDFSMPAANNEYWVYNVLINCSRRFVARNKIEELVDFPLRSFQVQFDICKLPLAIEALVTNAPNYNVSRVPLELVLDVPLLDDCRHETRRALAHSNGLDVVLQVPSWLPIFFPFGWFRR